MAKVYSKKRDELVAIIENIINREGESWKLPMVSINQRNEYSMYTTVIPVDASHILFRRIPRDYDDPEGIQRALKDKKVDNIEKLMREDNRFTSPNAVVANLLLDERQWGCTVEADHNNPKINYLIVDLATIQERLLAAEIDEEGFLVDEDNAMLGFLIDAHHRTEGMYQSGKMSFELPLTLYLKLPKEDMAKVFVDINQYQEKPSQIHTLAMRALSGTLSNMEEKANDMLKMLNTEDWSILKDRIKDIDSKRPKGAPKTYVNSSTFHALLYQQVLKHIKDSLSILNQTKLLNDYFKAWSDVFEEAWNDEKKHVLVKSMGFQIMMRLFSKIHSNAIIEGQSSTPDFNAYKSVIKQALGGNQKIKIGEGENKIELPINWASEFYGGYSSGKGINSIVNVLTQHITNKLHV
ncbi:DGQHR domain-containing protein [Neobacillus drentensis]|uniref:DGQHR domain-containing protein n=1 Tax=Neobacillus drentensis TaxID=220684 RepID=UPI003001B6EC